MDWTDSTSDLTAPPGRPDMREAPPSQEGLVDLFLSYNSRDHQVVQEVRQRLVSHGLTTFFDRESLNRGLPWAPELEAALRRSRAVAVFLGPNGLGVWQKREMALALDRQAQGEKTGARIPVIPVLLPGFRLDDPRHEPPSLLLLNTGVDLGRWPGDAVSVEHLARAAQGQSPPPAAPDLCPYRGLRPFREEDAPLLFGRETFAASLLEKARARTLVAVVGPSGSGKSSVVEAGLVPLLRREVTPRKTWGIVRFTPGQRPFHRVAAALVATWQPDITRRNVESDLQADHFVVKKEAALETAIASALEHSEGADRLLLIVDQFEELFTLTPDADRAPFIEALFAAAAASPVTLVLTLRADFYGQAIGLSRRLSDAIEHGLVNLGPMTPEELRRAIEEPARRVGLDFEPGLVTKILQDVERQPGNLPLLEYALTELWNRRSIGLLRHNAYDASGGFDGAIGTTAERVFQSLSPLDQGVALHALTRLVRVAAANEEGTDTRRRVRLADLGKSARSVDEFVRERLLVTDRDPATNDKLIEVAHEALIRNWDRLKELLNKDRAFLLWRQRLGFYLGEWERSGRDREVLLSGAVLAEAVLYGRARADEINEAEARFIEESQRELLRRTKDQSGWNRKQVIRGALVAVAVLSAFAPGGYYAYSYLPMNSRACCAVCGDCAEAVSGSSVGRPRQPPQPRYREPMPEDLVSQRCA